MTKDEALKLIAELTPTYDELRRIYVGDVRHWQAKDVANARKWAGLTQEQRQRVADLWKSGNGLYTLESCINGQPEYVFPPF